MTDASGTSSFSHFSLLSFNIFIGSPIPKVRVFTPCLDGDERLPEQLRQVKAVAADVVALQEMHSDAVLSAYHHHFGDEYHITGGHYRNDKGLAACGAIYLLLGLAGGGLFCLVVALLQPLLGAGVVGAEDVASQLGHALGFTLSSLAAGVVARRAILRSALINFLSGSCHGGLLLAVRRESTYRLRRSTTRNFSEQKGDFLNFWRPRAFQCVELEPAQHGRGTHGVIIVNLHMNLGEDDLRERQLEEAIAAAEAAAAATTAETGAVVTIFVVGDTNALEHLPSMVNMTSKRGFRDAWLEAGQGDSKTWSKANPLTNGILLEPCGRLDYIYFKAPLEHAVAATHASVVLHQAPFVSDHYGILSRFRVQHSPRHGAAAADEVAGAAASSAGGEKTSPAPQQQAPKRCSASAIAIARLSDADDGVVAAVLSESEEEEALPLTPPSEATTSAEGGLSLISLELGPEMLAAISRSCSEASCIASPAELSSDGASDLCTGLLTPHKTGDASRPRASPWRLPRVRSVSQRSCGNSSTSTAEDTEAEEFLDGASAFTYRSIDS